MSDKFTSDRLKNKSKAKRVIALIFIGIVLMTILAIVGVIVVAISNAVLGQTDVDFGQTVGNIIQSVWTYVTDFLNALWQQIIANPTEFITGGNG